MHTTPDLFRASDAILEELPMNQAGVSPTWFRARPMAVCLRGGNNLANGRAAKRQLAARNQQMKSVAVGVGVDHAIDPGKDLELTLFRDLRAIDLEGSAGNGVRGASHRIRHVTDHDIAGAEIREVDPPDECLQAGLRNTAARSYLRHRHQVALAGLVKYHQ